MIPAAAPLTDEELRKWGDFLQKNADKVDIFAKIRNYMHAAENPREFKNKTGWVGEAARKGIETAASTTTLFQNVCIMIIDMVDFSKFSNRMGIERLSKYLTAFYEKVDSAADSFRVEKFRSFGSFYTAISGVSKDNSSGSAEMVRFAVEILNKLKKTNAQNGMNLQLTIGIACGPVVVDLVSSQNFIFNAWGQPMILAEALHQTAASNSIHVSESVYAQLNDTYDFTETPEIEIEGMGKIRTWQLDTGGGGQKYSIET